MVSLFAVVLAAAPVVVPPFIGSAPEVGLAAQSVLAHDLRANGLEVRTDALLAKWPRFSPALARKK